MKNWKTYDVNTDNGKIRTGSKTEQEAKRIAKARAPSAKIGSARQINQPQF